MLFGRVSRKILLTHPKTISSKFSCQTRLELQMALASIVRWNWKNSFLTANTQDGFSTNRDKKYPMSTVKYTAVSLMLWACFSAGGPEHLVQMHGIMDSIKYQQIKNQNLTASVRNRIMGRGWIFRQDIKINTKMCHWAQNESFTMAVPVLWPEPYRKWVRWTEEKKHRHGAVNLKDLERFWMKKWSLISYQVFSKLFRHYRRKLRAVILGKGRCNNWVPIIVANMK